MTEIVKMQWSCENLGNLAIFACAKLDDVGGQVIFTNAASMVYASRGEMSKKDLTNKSLSLCSIKVHEQCLEWNTRMC